MVHAIMFDTLYYANKLKAAGVPATQAEVQAETLAEVMNEAEQYIATKHDIEKMTSESKLELQTLKTDVHTEIITVKTDVQYLKVEVANFRADMNVKFAEVYKVIAETKADMNVKFAEVYKVISETKNELIRWVIGISFGQTALIFTLLKVFH